MLTNATRSLFYGYVERCDKLMIFHPSKDSINYPKFISFLNDQKLVTPISFFSNKELYFLRTNFF